MYHLLPEECQCQRHPDFQEDLDHIQGGASQEAQKDNSDCAR